MTFFSLALNVLSQIFILSLSPAFGGPVVPRPDPEDLPLFGRWLVSQSAYGGLATIGQDSGPFANIISFADNRTGVPFFYLSPMLDPTGGNAVNNSRASFLLTEAVLGFCQDADPQSPACAKITLNGDLKLLEDGTEEAQFGRDALFAKHPQLKGYPLLTMEFNVFKLLIKKISIVTKVGPRKDLPVDVYLGRF